MVDPIMNLINEPHYEYERRKHHFHAQGHLRITHKSVTVEEPNLNFHNGKCKTIINQPCISTLLLLLLFIVGNFHFPSTILIALCTYHKLSKFRILYYCYLSND